MSDDAKAAKAAQKQAAQDAKAQAKADKHAQKQAEKAAKVARYKHLRANVRRRRFFYGLFIVLAIVTLVATVWDIVYNDSDLKWPLLAVYAVLFVLGLLLLLSRRRHLEEVNEIRALERTWLECDHCRTVFQFGQESFGNRRRVGFTCPVCGDESALPAPGSEAVERDIPSGQLQQANYVCGNCNEDVVVGVYGSAPRSVSFRACPKCGVAGQVRPNATPA